MCFLLIFSKIIKFFVSNNKMKTSFKPIVDKNS